MGEEEQRKGEESRRLNTPNRFPFSPSWMFLWLSFIYIFLRGFFFEMQSSHAAQRLRQTFGNASHDWRIVSGSFHDLQQLHLTHSWPCCHQISISLSDRYSNRFFFCILVALFVCIYLTVRQCLCLLFQFKSLQIIFDFADFGCSRISYHTPNNY